MQATTARWTVGAAQTLLDPTICPRCESTLRHAGVCDACSADLSGPEGSAVWAVSVRAAGALRERDSLIASLPPVSARPRSEPDPAVVDGTAASPGAQSPTHSGGRDGSGAIGGSAPDGPVPAGEGFSVQSLLAIAGAGLFAAAAVVFTFLNPDLTDPLLRIGLVAVIAAVFGVGSWLLGRARLALSAEVVGALGVVLWGLDLASIAAQLAPGIGWWTSFGFGTAITSLLLLALGARTRLRSWVWLGSVGLAVSPALFGYTADRSDVVSLGHLGSVVAGTAVLGLLGRVSTRLGSGLRADRVAVAILQTAAAVAVVVGALLGVGGGMPVDVATATLLLLGLAGAALRAARHGIPLWWSGAAGATVVLGVGVLPLAVVDAATPWVTALVPAAGLASGAVFSAIRWRGAVRAAAVSNAAAGTQLALALPAVLLAATVILQPVGALLEPASASSSASDVEATASALLGATAGAVGCLLAGRTSARLSRPGRARGWAVAAAWSGLVPLLGIVGWSMWAVPTGVTLGLLVVVALAVSIALLPGLRSVVGPAPSAVGAHLALILAAVISWGDGSRGAVVAGAPILAGLVVAATTVPRRFRPAHTAAGFAYALVLVTSALELTSLIPVAVLCLTVSAGALVALVATLWGRVPIRHWYAILAVTAVPFLVGVASVLEVRSGWTALSTGLILALALTLVLTRRPGLAPVVRALAASILVPSVAVVIVSLGAEWLESSGSPVVLPIIAVVVAAVLGSLRGIEARIRRRAGEAPARVLDPVLAIEISTLVTGALTVLLALVRDAAGLSTALVVLVLIGLGGVLTRLLARRPYGWWLAGSAWTAALWTVWAMLGVTAAEPYYLPTSLVIALIGAVALLRGRGGDALVISGLSAAIVPTAALLAAVGEAPGSPARTIGLLVAAGLLLMAGARLDRRAGGVDRQERFRMLRIALTVIGMVAATAGAIRGVRWGLDLDPAPDALMSAVTGVSAASVILLAFGARTAAAAAASSGAATRLARLGRARLLGVPALLAAAAGPITAIREEWGSIWTLWGLTLALLALLVVSAGRGATAPTSLPRPWLVFAVAWVVAVAGWSPRELRVEWFSLPLGLAVLLAGVVAFRRRGDQEPAGGAVSPPTRAALGSWPLGHAGSRRLLGPGIFLTLLPSVLATGTDPQTWRAILVIALALIATLVGSSLRLAAPFLMGLIVLPVENVVVFAVQIGRSIGALPWWITLATAGIVLLALAVSSERKTSRGGGVGARIRELR